MNKGQILNLSDFIFVCEKIVSGHDNWRDYQRDRWPKMNNIIVGFAFK